METKIKKANLWKLCLLVTGRLLDLWFCDKPEPSNPADAKFEHRRGCNDSSSWIQSIFSNWTFRLGPSDSKSSTRSMPSSRRFTTDASNFWNIYIQYILKGVFKVIAYNLYAKSGNNFRYMFWTSNCSGFQTKHAIGLKKC